MKNRILLVIFALLWITVLSACRNETGNHDNHEMDHSEMNHASGELPQGLKEAKNPKFPIGSEAVILDDHMPGMQGATAIVVGAYDTTVYTVSYVPKTGGDIVTNHKWVVHEEIENAGDKPFSYGDEVILTADHMKGMRGAKATINSAEQMTVYVVDYKPTTGETLVKDHKWVTESELSIK